MFTKLNFLTSAVIMLAMASAGFAATVMQYSFDGPLGGDVPDGLVDLTGNYTATIIAGRAADSAINYGQPNPSYNSGGTSVEFYNSKWESDDGDTFLIADSGGLDLSKFDAFTVEFFVYPASSGSGHDRRIFSEYIYAYMYLDTTDTLHAIRKWGPGGWNENWTHLTVANFPHDKWSHLAMVWDGNAGGDRFKLYINRELAASDAGTSTQTPDSTAGFAIGGYQRESGETAQFFHGRIDEFRLSDAALAPRQFLGATTTVSFDSPASGALESVSPAELTVTVSNAQEGQAYTVDYAITGGTATAGADYKLAGACDCDFDASGQVNFKDIKTLAENWLLEAPGNTANVSGDNGVNFRDFAICASQWLGRCADNTLRFAPGQSSGTIGIEIVDDDVPEGDKTIIVTLLNPSGGDLTLGSNPEHTYTIYNSAPKVSFAARSGSGPEHVTPAEIRVNLSYASSETITVDYLIRGGTATGGGVDYIAAPGTLSFAPGVVTQNISLDVVDDEISEPAETIELMLTNPTNATLGVNARYTYSITDNEAGVLFDGRKWYHSADNDYLRLNESGQLEWTPKKGHQIIVRLDEQRLSQVGDVAEVEYQWKSDGDDIGCDCGDCPGCFDDDITCVAGTGDFRIGVFDADGEYVTEDGMGTRNSVFSGYKGYRFRMFPHTSTSAGGFVCDGESHSSGSIDKRTDTDASSLVSINNYYTRLKDIRGFGLAVNRFSVLTLRLERTSSSKVKVSITLNGVTYSVTDSSSRDQPQKIDVFAIMLPNARPYDLVTLALP